MDQTRIIEKIEKKIKEQFLGESTGHDWWHIQRVNQLALFISKYEKSNLFVINLASLLHDIADWKFHDGNDQIGLEKAAECMKELNISNEIIYKVTEIIDEISFKGANVVSKPKTIEGMIVQDADRLDAIGAIGIARAFAFGGYKGQEIYNPEIKAVKHNSFEEYKKTKTTTINHFYEKLLLLKDLMNTNTALKIAEKRHQFMENYIENFLKDWKNENLFF